MIYLNNASTTRPENSVINNYEYFAKKYWHNPSDQSNRSLEVKKLMDEAASAIKTSINAYASDDIIFTSGGTESNNLAIKGYCEDNNVEVIITTLLEHSSIYNTCLYMKDKNGCTVEYVGNNPDGSLKLYGNEINTLQKILMKHANKKILITISHINNELGSIVDIKSVTRLVRKIVPSAAIHVDAVQSYGHSIIDVKYDDIDMMSTSFHKYGGLPGAGFLYVRHGIKISPIIHGGKQFNYLRSGTENYPMILTIGEHTLDFSRTLVKDYVKCSSLMHILVNNLHAMNEYIRDNFGERFDLIMNTVNPYRILNVRLKDIQADTIISMLEEKDIYISAGSACSSGVNKPSRILKAIGLSDSEALCCIRISINKDNDLDEIEAFVAELEQCIISILLLSNT